MDGFIFLHRKLLDSRLFKNEGLLKLWVWILLRANHQDKWFQIETGRGVSEINCQRGELIVGRNKASKELDMSPSRFYSLLTKLKRLKKVELDPCSHYTKIKVIKYSEYQGVIKDTKQASNKQETSKQQASNKQETGKQHKQESNKVNKEKKVNKVNKKDEQAPIIKSLHSKLKDLFIGYYNKETKDSYYWSAKDGANLKKLIQKISFSLKEREMDLGDEEIINSFNALLINLPQWYKIEAFDISSINSNYNKIINSVINGTKTKQAPSISRGFQEIDELFK